MHRENIQSTTKMVILRMYLCAHRLDSLLRLSFALSKSTAFETPLVQEPDRRSNDRGPCRCFSLFQAMCATPSLVRLAIHHIWYLLFKLCQEIHYRPPCLIVNKKRRYVHDFEKGVISCYLCEQSFGRHRINSVGCKASRLFFNQPRTSCLLTKMDPYQINDSINQ